jgi:hypothetical protein
VYCDASKKLFMTNESRLEAVLSELKQMQDFGISIDFRCYSLVFNLILNTSGEVADILDLVDRLHSLKLYPDMQVYAHIIATFSKMNRTRQLLSLVSGLGTRGISSTEVVSFFVNGRFWSNTLTNEEVSALVRNFHSQKDSTEAQNDKHEINIASSSLARNSEVLKSSDHTVAPDIEGILGENILAVDSVDSNRRF